MPQSQILRLSEIFIDQKVKLVMHGVPLDIRDIPGIFPKVAFLEVILDSTLQLDMIVRDAAKHLPINLDILGHLLIKAFPHFVAEEVFDLFRFPIKNFCHTFNSQIFCEFADRDFFAADQTWHFHGVLDDNIEL